MSNPPREPQDFVTREGQDMNAKLVYWILGGAVLLGLVLGVIAVVAKP